jgi:hypothetical protein
VLTLLMGVIYEYTVEMASGGMICVPSFIKIGTCVQVILMFCISNVRGCNVGITDRMGL